MNAMTLLEYQWPYILSFLPSLEVLEKSAKETGALVRKRNVRSASDLLRLIFAYGFCGLSLRQTAAWAHVANVAEISNVALLKRLRASEKWLGQLLAIKLAESATPPPMAESAHRVRLIDATSITKPGGKGIDWRIHLGFDLHALAIDHIELTDVKGGESFTRFEGKKGELFIGDAGYAHRRGLQSLVDDQADFIVRLSWQNVPLMHADKSSPFDIPNALRSLPEAAVGDFDVFVKPSKTNSAIAARLVAVAKSEAAAEAARVRVMRERSRKGRSVDPRTLESAGYIFVLTSLSRDTYDANKILELYRFRWQVELAFKRMKSLLSLDALPAKDPPLAKTFLYAKLLAALLLEDLTEAFLAFSPWGYRLADAPTVVVAHSKGAD